MILGVLEPSAGRIEIEGVDLAVDRSGRSRAPTSPPSMRRCPAISPSSRTCGCSACSTRSSNLSARIERLLAAYDLVRYRGTKAGVLSSGEQTRLGLAKAMLNRPRLLAARRADRLDRSLDRARHSRRNRQIRRRRTLRGLVDEPQHVRGPGGLRPGAVPVARQIVLEGDPKTLPAEHGAASLDDLFVNVAQEALQAGGAR